MEDEEGPNEQPAEENPEQRLEQFRNEMIRNLPNQQNQQNEGDQENEENEENDENNVTHRARETKLIILKENACKAEIAEKVEKVKTCSVLESSLFITETSKEGPSDHDYARPNVKTKQKSRKDPRARNEPRSRSRQVEEQEDEDEEEQPNEQNNENEQDSSGSSLDESDFSSADSTTEVSSEHSDWGSEHSNQNEERSKTKKSSPNKTPKAKKRHAAQKCREKMSLPNGDIGEEFQPSQWLSETIPRKTPYFPQIGDVLMYFKGGHERYIDLVEFRKAYKLNMREQQWKRKKTIEESTMVKVLDINFEIRPPR